MSLKDVVLDCHFTFLVLLLWIAIWATEYQKQVIVIHIFKNQCSLNLFWETLSNYFSETFTFTVLLVRYYCSSRSCHSFFQKWTWIKQIWYHYFTVMASFFLCNIKSNFILQHVLLFCMNHGHGITVFKTYILWLGQISNSYPMSDENGATHDRPIM